MEFFEHSDLFGDDLPEDLRATVARIRGILEDLDAPDGVSAIGLAEILSGHGIDIELIPDDPSGN